MKSSLKIAVGALIVLAAVFAVWRYRQMKLARRSGIVSENIVHSGDTWNADFVARIPAPETAVFDTIRNIESSHSSQIKAVRVVSSTSDSKRVEMDMAAPGGQTQTVTFDFSYDPSSRRIAYKSVGNPAFKTEAEYNFDDQGASTLIRLHQTTTMPPGVPLPDGVVKEVIRGIFMAQMQALQRSLHIADTNSSDSGDDD
jgi:hypothetical protein